MEKYLSTMISIGKLRKMESELAELRMIKSIYVLRVRKDVIDSIKRIENGFFTDDPNRYNEKLQEIAGYYPFLEMNGAVSDKLRLKIDSLFKEKDKKLEAQLK